MTSVPSDLRRSERTLALARCVDREYAASVPIAIAEIGPALFFLSDFVRNVEVPCEIDFLAVGGDAAARRFTTDLSRPIDGRDVLIVCDRIDDLGRMRFLLGALRERGPRSLALVSSDPLSRAAVAALGEIAIIGEVTP
ncbi:MAG: hypothetical protein HKL91_07045 [Candidatus Eremiobacteraeota bacterium]|uniref:Uncharacterized protein n=1 Tax=mine drainage metagenome TaxID=410659 RepID=E6PHM2_9ZZZZ|nr:hypothetical protein [Candidatus Eremiobacteraeota bacterium]